MLYSVVHYCYDKSQDPGQTIPSPSDDVCTFEIYSTIAAQYTPNHQKLLFSHNYTSNIYLYFSWYMHYVFSLG